MKRINTQIAIIFLLALSMMCWAETPSKPTLAKVIPIVPAETKPTPTKGQSRLWNLQDADILSIINEVSLETGKNFVVDPRVSGKISLISSKPIKPNEVYDVFLSVLSLLGYSAVPSGNVVKIVPNMESSEYATRIASQSAPGKGDEVVVRVIPLESVSANQLIPILRPLLPQWSNITAYTPGNVLILVGRAANLERIVKIIHSVDIISDNNIEMVPLRHASAGQLVNVLNNLQNAAKQSGDNVPISIAADERSNSILLSGNKTARVRMRIIISELDSPSSGAQGNTEVIYLRYLQAKTFAPILGKIAQNLMGKDISKTEVSASLSNTTQAYSTSGTSSGTTAIIGRGKEPENLTNIQAEPSTNSLIITAPPSMMRALNAIVAKLDIRPAQVLIEGIIVEINQDDLKNLGIQWGGLPNPDQPVGPGFPPIGLGEIGIIPGQQIQAILSLLQTISSVNILSTPSVVVLDNHKAVLDIGQDVPIRTGEYASNTNGGAAPFNTFSYKKVALVLEVIPQINLGNSVRLAVKLKNDSLQNPNDPSLNPLINTSQIMNAVIVNSCDILVIGGLIKNSLTSTIDKVPILGDVPLLGELFKHQIRKVEKRNLVVFLKPIIMYNAQDANAITHQKYELIREKQIDWPEDISKTGKLKAENILPPWRSNKVLPLPFEKV